MGGAPTFVSCLDAISPSLKPWYCIYPLYSCTLILRGYRDEGDLSPTFRQTSELPSPALILVGGRNLLHNSSIRQSLRGEFVIGTVFWTRWINFTSFLQIFSNIHFNITLAHIFRLPTALFPSGFPNKILLSCLFCPCMLHASPSPWISYASPLKDNNTVQVETELLQGACRQNRTHVGKPRISRSNAYPLGFVFWRPRFKSQSGYLYLHFS
jgi:hypothetical protein